MCLKIRVRQKSARLVLTFSNITQLQDLYSEATTVIIEVKENAARAHFCTPTHKNMAELLKSFLSVTVSDTWHILTPEVDQCRCVRGEIEIHRKLGDANDLLEQ